jgi:hypothetical protein
MATISNTPRPGYVWDSTDNVWYPIGVGGHSHSEIAKTIADAKGDLIVGTAADTVDRLAVGNNGETLVADSSTSTGLRYSPAPAVGNPVLNSAFQIWQRGTSIAQTGAIMYGADRWCSDRAGLDVGTTISRQATGDTTNLPNVQYCARVQRNNATTATTTVYFSQTLETLNSIQFAGKTITVSFYARKGANYSSASSALSLDVNSGTGTDQNVLSTYTGAASVISQTATLTTTWQRFTYTGTVASTATELGWYFSYTPVGTAGAADYFEVTGFQIDIGSVALPFRTYAATVQGELAACQRYYQRITNSASSSDPLLPWSGAVGTTQVSYVYTATTPFRVNPTSLDYAGVRIYDGVNVFNSPTLSIIGGSTITQGIAAVTTGLTQFRPYYLIANSSTINNSYVGLSAEL